ncbi:MAG: threonylcarbamoyl-AMP synthase [Deltaproteobacteria bacterium]|nr:threonylcarbamoyl-AMP synthase [Deltaproteobacteria bacterium]
MKTIPLSEFETDSTQYKQIADTLDGGGLVCLPASSGYKLVVDLSSPTAITAMQHAKRRVKNAPALVFVPDAVWVDRLAAVVSDEARRLMQRFWPGPVTLLLKASDDLHPKVRKPLTKAKGWLGVRVPEDEITLGVVRAFGRPVLVSSANLARKHGAHSVAQVKKNFGRTVDLLVDAGDVKPSASSTLVDVSGPGVSVVRAGAITEDSIHEALAG